MITFVKLLDCFKIQSFFFFLFEFNIFNFEPKSFFFLLLMSLNKNQ